MNSSKNNPAFGNRKMWIAATMFMLVSTAALFFYINFNRLLSEALMKSFNSNIVSDVYELKFKGLNVDIFSGNIRVKEVELHPREKSQKEYPNINSSFRLTTKRIILSNVAIFELLRENKLKLDKVEILDPDIQFIIADIVPVFFPTANSPKDTITTEPKDAKRILQFSLKKFDLINATFHVANLAKGRDLSVKQVNLTISELLMDPLPGKDLISFTHFNFFVGEITGSLQRDQLKQIYLKDYKLDIDSMKIRKTNEKLVYRFHDIRLGLRALDLQTGDSIFHLALGSLDLSYRNRSLTINKLVFEPNISEADMQKRFQYQHTQFAGQIGSLKVSGLDFDSLLFKKKLLVNEISLDSVFVAIFKDKTKPMDLKKFPAYLGQAIRTIGMPMEIKNLNATDVNLVNRERKVNASIATANINRGTANVENITNIDSTKALSMRLNAYLEDKVQFDLKLGFDYLKPQFSIEGSFDKFNLTDLNQLLKEYTPAKINSGTVDAIQFSGTAYQKEATGTMKFLYHNLDIDLELKDKARWKSSVLAFAANAVVASSNPTSPELPAKVVKYHVDRDMNKSFVNITIKSALAGLKETVLMSKENRKAHNERVKKAKEAKKK
jgi:hypothetical protein